MNADFGCDEVRELAAELALGIAHGDERARALEHLAECGECRAHVAQLAGVADDLLLLAPRVDPPLGFEARVLEQIAPRPRRRGFRFRPLAFAGVAAATAAVTAIVMVAAFHGDNHIRSVALRDAAGVRAGEVFAYEGRPSWVYVTVAHHDRLTDGYRCEVVTRDGRRIPMQAYAPDAQSGSWGGPTPVPLDQVSAIEVTGGERGEVLVARLERG